MDVRIEPNSNWYESRRLTGRASPLRRGSICPIGGARNPLKHGGRTTRTISMSGIESLSHGSRRERNNHHVGVYFSKRLQLLDQECSVAHSNRNHIWFYQSAIARRAIAIFTVTANAASQSYGAEQFMARTIWLKTTSSRHITAPMMNAGGTGSIFVNYAVDDFYLLRVAAVEARITHARGTVSSSGKGTTDRVSRLMISTGAVTSSRIPQRLAWLGAQERRRRPFRSIWRRGTVTTTCGKRVGQDRYHTRYEAAALSSTMQGTRSVGDKVNLHRRVFGE